MAHRTQAEYESVFRTLMTYSRFRNVKDINMVNLPAFFEDMKEQGISISDEFNTQFSKAYDRLAEQHHKNIKHKVEEKHFTYTEKDVDEIIEDIFYRLKRESRRKRHLSLKDIEAVESVIMRKRK